MSVIQSSSAEASQQANELLSGNESYCSFVMQAIYGPSPVPGSNTHDGTATSMQSSLASYRSLLLSDAQAIVQTGFSFDSVDNTLAMGLMGLGGY